MQIDLRTFCLCTIALTAIIPGVFGGTVITNNLPPDTAIVNISGTQDGSASYSGSNQSLWYQPFYTSGATNFVEFTLQPGSYGFRVVDPADALKMFPSLTPTQTNLIYTGWTYNSPWITDYLVFDSAAATNKNLPQIFDGAFDTRSYSSPQAAYDGVVADGYYNVFRTGPDGRNSTNYATAYTVSSPETLIFVVPDYGLGDNAGGVSVLVAPSAPLLNITSGAGGATLFWGTNPPGFTLQRTGAFAPAAWRAVTNLPMVVGNNDSVTLPLSGASAFFRLSQP